MSVCRSMKWRKKNWRVWSWSVLVLLCIFFSHLYHSSKCSNGGSIQLISDLCDLYNQGEVAGSFCPHLCGETKTLRFEQCGNYWGGKKVMFLTCDSCVKAGEITKVVMKTKTTMDKRIMFEETLLNSNEEGVKSFLQLAESLVKDNFNSLKHHDFSNHSDILSFAWNWDVKEFVESREDKTAAVETAVESIWSLIQQPEYLVARDLYSNSFMPKVYGTCGPAYFVENTPTLYRYEYEIFRRLSTSTWKERASIAIKIIELMDVLYKMNKEYHLCDIKLDNFGLRDNGEITLIDTDMFYKNQVELKQDINCTTHKDCDFFDCKSFCVPETRKCIKRINNNMQSICEDVFLGFFPKLQPTGLLRDPPSHIKVELSKLLEECSFQPTTIARKNIYGPASDLTVNTLKALLQRSIQKE